MRTDICIVGGGLVGLAAALVFSARGQRVCLLESANLEAQQPPLLDARSLALSHSSIQILRALGLWQALQPSAAAISHIHVSSAGHFGVTRLHAQELQLDAMGYVVEYHVLMQSLLQQVRQNDRIDIISPAHFDSLEQQATCVALHYRGREDAIESLQAGLLVIADGAASSVRQFLGIDAQVRDFMQNAIVANVQLEGSGQGVAFERFTASGPMAMLPLTANRYALVWTNGQARGQQLMHCAEKDFLQALYEAFGYRLGYFRALGERDLIPLKLTRAAQLVSGRCVVIGNAANTLHPVAGQGLNLAMRDIAALYDLLQGIDPHAPQVTQQLEAYPQLRRADQDRAVRLSTLLVDLFSNDLPVLNHARSGALAALDLCPLLKQEFSWQGMGFGAGVSGLLRGVL